MTIGKLSLVLVTTLVTMASGAGVATATPSAGAATGPSAARQAACVALETARSLRAVDSRTWLTRVGRDAAIRAALIQAKSACVPAPYEVRVEAVQGRDPVTGTLRISCRAGFNLSPANPAGAYFVSFGALTPDTHTTVTRSARTATSFEIDYTIQPSTPVGGGIYLKGTCVPA